MGVNTIPKRGHGKKREVEMATKSGKENWVHRLLQGQRACPPDGGRVRKRDEQVITILQLVSFEKSPKNAAQVGTVSDYYMYYHN